MRTVNSSYLSYFHPLSVVRYIEKMPTVTLLRTMSLWDASEFPWSVWFCSRLLSFTLLARFGFAVRGRNIAKPPDVWKM